MPRIGIIYSTNSKMIRRIIVPDHEWELHDPALLEGESILIVDKPPSHDIYTCEAIVHQHTGVKPARHVCAIHNANGEFVGHAMADPEVDKIHGHTLRIVK
jgi:hypothetical protein